MTCAFGIKNPSLLSTKMDFAISSKENFPDLLSQIDIKSLKSQMNVLISLEIVLLVY